LFHLLKLHAFLLLSVLVFSCASQVQKDANVYYLGLLDKSVAEKVKLFEKSLFSPNEYIRQASAEELAILMSQGRTFSRKITETVRRELSGFWAEAFNIVSAPDKEKALSFFFRYEQNSASFTEAIRFIIGEYAKKEIIFSEQEMAAIEGHYFVSGLRYNEALNAFRAFQTDGAWAEKIPEIFVRHPALISDLGKIFQYTQSSAEGLALFLQWLADKNLPSEVQFRLNFYAGRIARRIGGQNAKSISLFEQALAFAPDAEQADACIWYILDLTVTGSTNSFFERLTKFIPDWHKASYYSDILERLLHKLVTERDWNKVIKTYNMIQNTDAVIPRISYARVIARAIENKYLSAADSRLAAQIIDAESADALAFYRIAYDIGVVSSIPSFIYRSQSAEVLNKPFLEFTEEKELEKKDYSPLLQFIMGFFENNAVDFLLPQIRELEKNLTVEELRVVAKAFHDEGIYTQSMRIASSYMFRNGYSRNKRDWEMMFPRPYLELVEKYAKEYDISPSLLYGLIRSESAFREAVVSHAGAVGLMQLMPRTAKDMAERLKREGGPDYFNEDGVVDSTNPTLNVHIGTYYFKYLQDYFDNTVLALMAYNGGQNRIRRLHSASNLPIDLFVETVPIYETRDYGKRVPAAARIYHELYYKDQ